MKTKLTFSLFLTIFLCLSSLKAQTVTPLYDFEPESTQSGTYALYWAGAPYIKAFDVIDNPVNSGINTSSKVLRIQEEGVQQWWNNTVIFSLTTPVTITSANRYLHIKHLRPRITGGGFIVSLNAATLSNAMASGSNRFDANLSAINTWQDIVIDLNTLKTNNTDLSNIEVCIDINNWGSASSPLGDYLFDDIILSSSPLPRGTTFLTANNLYDFEPGTASNISGISTSADAGNPVTYPIANPFQNATNSSSNVGKRSAVSSINWWVGFGFSFTNPIQIDVNHKYLHIMMIVPSNGQSVAFDIKQGATNVIADGVQTITTANTWQDVVLDVSGMAYISGMSIKCGNWGGTAAGDYYFDEIYIDGNAAPRANIATALKTETDKINVYALDKTICIDNKSSENQVTIFNVNGQKILSKQIGFKEFITINNSGLYLVKIGNQLTKVIVK
jgi:hypothetical protein